MAAKTQFVGLHQCKNGARGHEDNYDEQKKAGKIIAIARMKTISKTAALELDCNISQESYTHFYEIREVIPLDTPIPARGMPSIFWKVKRHEDKTQMSNVLFKHLGLKERYRMSSCE